MSTELTLQGSWRGTPIPKVILGTVQLGMPYGIANASGQPDYPRARALVEAAWEGGVRHFDTAQAYGESEAVLGRILQELGVREEACITSKLDAALDPAQPGAIRRAVEDSFRRLGGVPLWAMLFHRPEWLACWDQGLGEILLNLQAEGLVRHLGASLARPDQGEAVLAQPEMAVIQIPANAWDRRLTGSGFFTRCHAADRFCCVRSIYLQGLLTLPADAVAKRLPAAQPLAAQWNAIAAVFDLSPKALAASYAASLGQPLVIGAEHADQVRESLALLDASHYSAPIEQTIREKLLPLTQENLLDPAQWPKLQGNRP